MDKIIDSIDDDENLEEENFPGFTKWHRGKFCCIKNAIFIDNLPNVVFLGHWDFQPGFPIGVSSIIISSYLFAMIFILPSWKLNSGVIMGVLISITFSLFLYSYFRIIIDGPGYFPFYWPIQHKQRENFFNEDDEKTVLINRTNDELSPSGILSTKEQVEWARDRIRPNRCIMAGRRIVIRPDHFCGWTSSYIGKRNYKFFLLFNFWGFVYISLFMLCCIVELVNEFNCDVVTVKVMFSFFFVSLALFFLLMTGSFTGTHAYQMCINQTLWEDNNGIDDTKFDKGCIENISDVCGPWSKWYTFLLPISPWVNYSNTELINDYTSYNLRKNIKKKNDIISKLIVKI